jgi:predicted 2-oxoglutarate/Fe(II)-dependent dioxygenase YbiX/peroxiredoxin
MEQKGEEVAEYVQMGRGDPAPWFVQRSMAREQYSISSAAGRYLVLCFFGSATDDHTLAALAKVRSMSEVFDDLRASFFGITNDRNDEQEKRISESYPGYRFILDYDGAVGRQFGVLPVDSGPGARVAARRCWMLLDPTLRVISVIPFAEDRQDLVEMEAQLRSLPPIERFVGFDVHAPIIILPNVFEPEFCAKLIGLYEAHGGEESGFMREVDGRTVVVNDNKHKRRKDYQITDEAMTKAAQAKFHRRVVPEIMKVHQFKVTRMERYIVACYAAEDEAHFSAHRDNTTKGTAHRRFAVSVNLNEDFDGGEVSFPEYGPRSYKAPAGGAVVFSCSLLHAVSMVTRGRRYAFLPFLYDDAAAAVRRANNEYLGPEIGEYGTKG